MDDLQTRALSLSPRRQELIATIRTHQPVSFDYLARNFRGVAIGTLHYDLQQLIRGGFIRKLGTTRGALYAPAVNF